MAPLGRQSLDTSEAWGNQRRISLDFAGIYVWMEENMMEYDIYIYIYI